MKIRQQAAGELSELVAAAASSHEENCIGRAARLTKDPASTGWIAKFVGRYSSEELGSVVISQRGNHYWADFEGWSTQLGVSANRHERGIVLMSAPWSGSLRLLAAEDARSLTLNATQQTYVFLAS